jgi:hypothetical protein
LTVLEGFDAAYPPAPALVAGKAFAGFYVGGAALNVWTPAEVKSLHAMGIIRGMPIVVAPLGWQWAGGIEGTLRVLVDEALAWGIKAGMPLCVDIEQSLADKIGAQMNDVAKAWAKVTYDARLDDWVYGSVGTCSSFSGGHWVAQWGPEPANWDIWQYQGGNVIDLDRAKQNVVFMNTNLGAPPPIPPGGMRVNPSLPLMQHGHTGAAVSSLQKVLGNVAVDGVFGPHTEQSVRNFQANHGLAVDGIVGQHTYEAIFP